MLIKLVLLVNPSKATALSSFSPVITSLFIYHWLHIYIFLCLSVQKSQLHQAHVFIGLSHALLYSVSPTVLHCLLFFSPSHTSAAACSPALTPLIVRHVTTIWSHTACVTHVTCQPLNSSPTDSAPVLNSETLSTTMAAMFTETNCVELHWLTVLSYTDTQRCNSI